MKGSVLGVTCACILLAGCHSASDTVNPPPKSVSASPHVYSSLTEMGNAVKKGMTEEEVVNLLGEPEFKRPSLLGYAMKGNAYDTLAIRIKDGRVESVSGFIGQKPVTFQ